MTEILSQNEIDGLLLAISSGDVESDGCSGVREKKKLKIYDFRRPDKFTKEQFRMLQMMHETFARLTASMLANRLRIMTTVTVVSVDQLTYEEFTRSIPDPAVLAVLSMEPLPNHAVIEIDPGVAFAIIECLHGGGNTEYASISRELTDIELLQMERIITAMISNLSYTWASVLDLKTGLSSLETKPHFAQIVPPEDLTALITLEINIGSIAGLMNICLPYITIEPVIDLLSQQGIQDFNSKATEKAGIDTCNHFFKRYIDYSGAIPNMKPDDLRKLKTGMKIELNTMASAKNVYEFAGIKKVAHNV